MPKPSSRSRPRWLGSALACLALLAGGLIVSASGASAASSAAVGRTAPAASAAKAAAAVRPAAVAAASGASCTAAYSVQTQWNTGFTAALTVTNNGTTPITGWTVTYSYTGNQTLANGWNGNWTQSGEAVTVSNLSYNGSLAAGANTSLGANFNYSGTNTAPTNVTCTPAGATQQGSIVAAPTTLSVAQGGTGTFTLALSQAPTANETVNITATGNTGLTAAPTSLTFTPANFATAQTVTVTANATGTGTTTFTASGSGYTSATITATETAVVGTAKIVATPTTLSVAQGGTGTFTLALSQAPTANETVSIAATGNTGLTAAPTSLTFTPANFATAQTVTVTANTTGTGNTTFTASGTGYTSATVVATETTVTPATIVATPTSLSVAESSTGTFTLALSTAPAASETVTLTATGNAGLTASPATLTFTPANFATAQTVTVTADASSTGNTTFTAAGTGYTSATIVATETPKVTAGAAPMVSISSPTAGEIFTPGSAISLSAAPVAGSGNVTSVTFYQSTTAANDTLIGASTTAPFTFQWTNVPAGSYSITAVASNGTESLTSYPIAITVEAATVVTNPVSVSLTQGGTETVGVDLSAAPTASQTVSLAVSGDSDLTVSPASLTFTTSNWSTPQTVTVTSGSTAADGGAQGTITASATGYANGTVTATEALAGSKSAYDSWFLNLYDKIMNPNNGYFSPKGIPYHSVETLIVEAPDYGHETTSETYSYYIWLTAEYGQVTGNWTPFNTAWTSMQNNIIPSASAQPGQSTYNASSPATYGPEEPDPNNYPVNLNSSVPVGSDPLAAELTSTYGTSSMYTPMWIMDTDNRYGFGQCEDGTSTPSFVNSYERGPLESVWDTIPQPDCDMFKFGGPNGFLDLFNNGGGSFATQYKYTDAPDADARMVQAAFIADTAAKAQGKESAISATLADAAKLGDYLRYSMFDKYFKQISSACSQDGSVACPAGTSKANEDTFLLSWYYAFGGASTGAWSWRISGTTIHEGYQNPVAAFALSTDSDLIPLSPTAKSDWATSLTTQLNLFQWLQSSQGAIAGGVTNNWAGNYGDSSKPPAGDATFDGMYYTPAPEYDNPPSNQWFGFQTWPMERLAEYYFDSGNTQAQAILAKWVAWAESVTSFNTSTGAICLPGTLNWSGQPSENWTTGTSSTSQPPANTNLSVSVTGGCSADLGVSASLAKVLEFYGAKAGDTTAETDAQNIIDVIHKFYGDSIGFSSPETRTDYINFTSPYNTTNFEGVFFPANWTGKYPGNIPLSASTNTFLSIRPWYIGDPQWSKVQAYLNGGAAPTFNYHRFWAEADIATAFTDFAQLFPTVSIPSGF